MVQKRRVTEEHTAQFQTGITPFIVCIYIYTQHQQGISMVDIHCKQPFFKLIAHLASLKSQV